MPERSPQSSEINYRHSGGTMACHKVGYTPLPANFRF